MIEIYLFVNPLGSICLNTEKDILQLVATETEKIQFRFIPLVNMEMINYVLKLYNIKLPNIAKRNKLLEEYYSAALDYKAAQLQGKKKGRHLLLKLQETVANKKKAYSPQLSEKFILEAGGDLAMFKSDRQSNFVKESFQTDQKIAREMGVISPPSAVVFNYACDYDYGVLIENCYSIDEIKKLCQPTDKKVLGIKNLNKPSTSQEKLYLL